MLVGRDDADALRAAELAAAVGVGRIAGYLAGGMTSWREERLPIASIERITVPELHERSDELQILDVRERDEWEAGHIPGSLLHALPRPARAADGLDPTAPVAVICASGQRAAVGASLVQRHGAREVLHVVDGGVAAWSAPGLAGRALGSRLMAVPRLRVPSASSGGSLRQAAGLSSDEVELYHRTYTTLLRSSGETLLRVLEPSHAAMSSSLHSLAHDMEEPDLGAFLYSLRRLPASIWKANVIVVGQESEAFAKAGHRADRGLGGGRGARPPAALVRLRARDARGPAGLDVGPRRRDPDARRLPARVEQAARAAARGGAAGGARAARRRRGVRRLRGGLDAPARVVAGRARRVRQRGPRRAS